MEDTHSFTREELLKIMQLAADQESAQKYILEMVLESSQRDFIEPQLRTLDDLLESILMGKISLQE
jgi:Trp operon repressor